MLDRDAVLAHAERYWFRPCEDGDVWLNNAPINVKNKLNELGLSPAEWDCVFLQDNSWIDHLFAVRDRRLGRRVRARRRHGPGRARRLGRHRGGGTATAQPGGRMIG